MSVSVCLSVCPHTYLTNTLPIFAEFSIHVAGGRVSVILRRRCDKFCILPVLRKTSLVFHNWPYDAGDVTGFKLKRTHLRGEWIRCSHLYQGVAPDRGRSLRYTVALLLLWSGKMRRRNARSGA